MTVKIATNWPAITTVFNRSLVQSAQVSQIARAATYLAGRRRVAYPSSLRRRVLGGGANTFPIRVGLGPLDHRVMLRVTLDSTWTEFADVTLAATSTYDATGDEVSLQPGIGQTMIELIVGTAAGTTPTAPGTMDIELVVTCPPDIPGEGDCCVTGITVVPLPFGSPWGPESV